MSTPVYYGSRRKQHEGFVVGVERLSTITSEVRELNRKQIRELASSIWSTEVDPDYHRMCRLEEDVKLVLFTVRDPEDNLVGTTIMTLSPHLAQVGAMAASDACVFILKPAREAGLASVMLEFIVDFMKHLKIDYLLFADWSFVGGNSLESRLQPLGFKTIGRTYMAKLGE